MNEKPNQLDLTMTALAHPTRRAILQRVMHRESRVTELAHPYAISLNAVSKHIRILERAGLVRRGVFGANISSRSIPRPFRQASDWIDKTRAFWNKRLHALDALLKAEDAAAKLSEKKGHVP